MGRRNGGGSVSAAIDINLGDAIFTLCILVGGALLLVTVLVDEDASGECLRPVPMAFLKGTEPPLSCVGAGERRAPALTPY